MAPLPLAHLAQAAISATVRPQPIHKLDKGSMTQILTQGVEIVGADMRLI